MKLNMKQEAIKSGRAIARAAFIVIPAIIILEMISRLASQYLSVVIGIALLIAIVIFLAKWPKD